MGNSLSIFSFPSETIGEILKHADLSTFINLLSVSERILQISSLLHIYNGAHISSENAEPLKVLDLIKNISRYLNVDQFILKHLCANQTRGARISKDFPIHILMISSLEKLGDYETTNFDQVAILILSPRKKDEKFDLSAINQYRNFFSSKRFPVLKIVIINYQSTTNDEELFFNFNELDVDYVLMDNCSFYLAFFPRFKSIKRIIMYFPTFYGRNMIHSSTLVEKCHIINPKAYSVNLPEKLVLPPSLIFFSKELKSLQVRDVLGHKNEDEMLFTIYIASQGNLEKLIWQKKDVNLMMDHFAYFSKLKDYYGVDPSKVKVTSPNQPQEKNLKSLLYSNTKIYIQKEIGDIEKADIIKEKIRSLDLNTSFNLANYLPIAADMIDHIPMAFHNSRQVENLGWETPYKYEEETDDSESEADEEEEADSSIN